MQEGEARKVGGSGRVVEGLTEEHTAVARPHRGPTCGLRCSMGPVRKNELLLLPSSASDTDGK